MNKKTKRGQIYRPSQDDTKKRMGKGEPFRSRSLQQRDYTKNSTNSPLFPRFPSRKGISVVAKNTVRLDPDHRPKIFPRCDRSNNTDKDPASKKHSLLCCSFSLVDFITHDRDERRHFGMNGKANPCLPYKMKTVDAERIRLLCRPTPMQCRFKMQKTPVRVL